MMFRIRNVEFRVDNATANRADSCTLLATPGIGLNSGTACRVRGASGCFCLESVPVEHANSALVAAMTKAIELFCLVLRQLVKAVPFLGPGMHKRAPQV
jgi:hypothetical protein